MSATTNHVYLYGDSSLDEKISLLQSKVGSSSGRDAWVQLFRSNPSILLPYEISVLFRSTTTSTPITFMFEVSGGSYNIFLRCFGSTPAPASGKSQLDSGSVLTWSTAPGYTVYQQTIPLYTATTLSAGLHQVIISSINPIALLDMTIQNTNGSEDVVIQAINTFLFPNRVQTFPSSLQPEYIVPALNTRLFGPTLPPGATIPPYTGTPHPETCFDPTDTPLFSANPILLLSGTQTVQQKVDVANQIRTYCGRTQWVKFLNAYPNIVSGTETAVILNSTDAALTFRFAVPPGPYNVVVRCIMPSANADSGYVQLDSFPQQMFTRAFGPGKYSTTQFNVLLYEKLKLDDGYHQMVFTSREPMGYIALIINRADRQFQDIVITADAVLKNPFQVFGNADYLANFTPPVFTTIPPTTTPPPMTTMIPTTTMMPTTTMKPQLTIVATGSYNVSNLVNGYRYYTFTGAGTIKVNLPTKANILLVGAGGTSGSGQMKTQSSGYAWGGGGGAGGIGYGSMNFSPNTAYSISVSQNTSISGQDASITATMGNSGSDGRTSNYSAFGGRGGSSGSVTKSGNVDITSITGDGSSGESIARHYTDANGGNGGGNAFGWIDSVSYGGGGQKNVNVSRYGQGGPQGWVYKTNGGGGSILKLRFYFG